MKLEVRVQSDKTPVLASEHATVLVTPPVDENYWAYRVQLTDEQAVIGFPKFTTIGIGFAQEEDWNTNFPYSSPAEQIASHIWHNAGDESITREQVIEAIGLIQQQAILDRSGS